MVRQVKLKVEGQELSREPPKAIATVQEVLESKKDCQRKNKTTPILPTTLAEKDGNALGLSPEGNKHGN